MKWNLGIGKILLLLVPVLLVEQIGAQRPIRFPGDNSNCPSGTRCMEFSRCRPRILSMMTEEPIECGYTYNWRRRICCPSRSSVPNQVPPRPRPGPNTEISRPEAPQPVPAAPIARPEAPAPVPDRPRIRPVVPAPINNVPRPRPEVSAPVPDRPRTRPVVPAPINNVPRPGPVATAAISVPDSENCGVSNRLQGFVVGGDLANEGAWPWLVSVAMRTQSGLFSGWCTGSMITRRHVVSAAHCFENRDTSLYVARVGNVNQSQAQQYTISQIVTPETYVRGRFYDDIAILTLSEPVNTENFNPICLPPSRNFVNLTGEGTAVAGWGSTEPGGPLSESLRQLTGLPVMSNEQCDRELTSRVTGFRGQFNRGISVGLICAAFMEGGRDTCAGDSGGPMMYLNDDDRWYLVGVVSFGISCAEPGFPAGYTRVTEYLDFIRSNIRD